jgi:alpha-beta hydrolase superfamily lysophospholipase
MLRRPLVVISIPFISLQAGAAVVPFPPALHEMEMTSGDATLHVRVGGQGPAVVMLHGFGDTGDMWAPLAADLVQDHTVVIPDLRGMGLSSHPQGGYNKRSQAADITAIPDKLNIARAALVTHRLYHRPRTDRHDLYRGCGATLDQQVSARVGWPF